VEQGKGAKDRYTLLSPRLLSELRRYWVAYRPRLWLFPAARVAEQPMPKKTPHLIYPTAKDRAGITKAGGIHAARATPLPPTSWRPGSTCTPSSA
jgi:integrase